VVWAKGAVEILTRYLAKELGPRKITANVVAPGPIQTDFSGGMVRDNPEINKRVSAMTALGRPGLPDDVGPMIAALLSDENRWVKRRTNDAAQTCPCASCGGGPYQNVAVDGASSPAWSPFSMSTDTVENWTAAQMRNGSG
jgi:NAD(P)-dependent dehydrogenase (short-subunit alcohol dehydrogenase family)